MIVGKFQLIILGLHFLEGNGKAKVRCGGPIKNAIIGENKRIHLDGQRVNKYVFAKCPIESDTCTSFTLLCDCEQY